MSIVNDLSGGSNCNSELAYVSDYLCKGVQVIRVTRRKSRSRILKVDFNDNQLYLDNQHKFDLNVIRDMRYGDDAKHYRELCRMSEDCANRWLSIVYFAEGHKFKVLHVIFQTSSMMQSAYDVLSEYKARHSNGLSYNYGFFRHAATISSAVASSCPPSSASHATGKTINPTNDLKQTMTFLQIKRLCDRLNYGATENQLRTIFCDVDKRKEGFIDFEAFKEFVHRLKHRKDLDAILKHVGDDGKLSREHFRKFLVIHQGWSSEADKSAQLFQQLGVAENEDTITKDIFHQFILSSHNDVLRTEMQDMSRPLNEYFISSSHNTYLSGRQIGDESSIEPYISSLQRGCRCVEIDIWSGSDNVPEVRHGRAFTSAVSLAAVLQVVDKYAFITSPWPLIISLEIRCSVRAQEQVTDLLLSVFGESLLKQSAYHDKLPSPITLRHKILLKVKSTDGLPLYDQLEHMSIRDTSFHDHESAYSTSAAESDVMIMTPPSRSSSMSSQTSQKGSTYRTLLRPNHVIPELVNLAPYLIGLPFKNFSLPESKSFNHIFSLSERTMKNFSHDTTIQARKHNTRFMMRIYPSQARLMSSNFIPIQYWQLGAQLVALNWQTPDLGMQINEAFFGDSSDYVSGYVLKPAHLRQWQKGQELIKLRWPRKDFRLTIISGYHLFCSRPWIEIELIRPTCMTPHPELRSTHRQTKYKTDPRSDGFDPTFDFSCQFTTYEDEDPFFTFLRLSVKEDNETITSRVLPLQRIQRGYRSVNLTDPSERIHSSLLIYTSH